MVVLRWPMPMKRDHVAALPQRGPQSAWQSAESATPQSPIQALNAELEHLETLLGFAIGLSADQIEASDRVSKPPNPVLADIVAHFERRFKIDQTPSIGFCAPTELHAVPGSAVDGYVLGPPTDLKSLSLTLDENEVDPDDQEAATAGDGGASGGRSRRGVTHVGLMRLMHGTSWLFQHFDTGGES